MTGDHKARNKLKRKSISKREKTKNSKNFFLITQESLFFAFLIADKKRENEKKISI